MGAPDYLVETQDVLVEPMASATAGDFVYRVQLQSFPSRSGAVSLRATLADEEESELPEDLQDDIVIWREAGSGRWAVRLGAFASEAGARARLGELRDLGFELASVVREPRRAARPRALVLRPVGQPAVQTPSLTLYAVPQVPDGWIEVDGRPYRGYVELFVNGANAFTVVNVVNLEDYLKGVVPAELSPKAFPEKEAIKAQAIAARTYAVKRRGEFAADGYDICASPACQVYRGFSAEQPMSNEAVVETAREVLTYQGELVDALYTSTCGGRTENAENVFSTPQPYLVSRACYLESRRNILRSAGGGATSLEAATLELLGIVPVRATATAVDWNDAREWVGRAVSHLGQTPCWSDGMPGRSDPVDVVELATLLGEGLCWERRLPFLMRPADASRIVPLDELTEAERLYLAYAIQENLILPDATGIERGVALERAEVIQTLYRLIGARGEPPLRPATLRRIDSGRLWITDDTLGDEDNELSSTLAPRHYLFRRAGEDATTYYARELALLPGDRILFHMGNGGIDVLVLVSEGASFDRSSRVSHWVVRKTNEDLSREVGSRGAMGRIVALRPKRYGRSGRIIELEVVGTSGTLELTGLQVRRALGIRENLFFIDAQRGVDGEVQAWVFTGRGWGHGVGMCQVGAYGMAAAGYDYRQILSHYYAGTRVERRDVDNYRAAP